MLKILYIEDDPAHIELTRRSLETNPAEFELNTALTIKDALNLLDTTGYDVILCDHRLPDGSGLDVIKLVHERGITTSLVLITNQEDINTAVAALKAGAADYVVKQSDYLLKLPIVLSNAYSAAQLEKQKSALIESQNKYRNIYENSVEGIFQSTLDGRYLDLNPAMAHIYGYESPEDMLENVTNIGSQIHSDIHTRQEFITLLSKHGFVKNFEAQDIRKDGGFIWTSTNARAVKDKSGNIIYFEGFLTDITERKHAEEMLERQLKELTVLHAAALAESSARDMDELIQRVTDIIGDILYSDNCGVLLMNSSGDALQPHFSYRGTIVENLQSSLPLSKGISGKVATTREPIRIGNVSLEPDYYEATPGIQSELCVPIISSKKIFGVLNAESKRADAFTDADERLLNTIAGGLATALERFQLFESEKKRRQEAEHLRLAATAITSSLDPKEVLETILTSLRQVVPFDSATMMRLEDEHVRIAAAQGFRDNNAILNQKYPADNKLLLVINETQKPLILHDATKDARFENWAGAYLTRGWMGIPLIVHGKIIGYITLDSQTDGAFDSSAAALAQTFALQAAAAIDNTQLFENLQRSNQELSLAYDTTLEGWGKALELRDKETHGHTHRVTDLTMELARVMGLSKAELTHLRRGVLLHDIGKMGVPDEILRKKGPLTREEWVEMRKHPQYAFDLLYPISFLRPSLEIPYSHHEWWDGSGYPRGLRGEEIPLAARIFTVVDVWDALLSNRPYRKAWTQSKVINHIQALSGRQFDPQVAAIFMQMINSNTKPPDKSRTTKGSKKKNAGSVEESKKPGNSKKMR